MASPLNHMTTQQVRLPLVSHEAIWVLENPDQAQMLAESLESEAYRHMIDDLRRLEGSISALLSEMEDTRQKGYPWNDQTSS